MSRLTLDVWSDVACPWCYLGKRRLEHALEQFPQRANVELHWRSFELDPSAPRELDRSLSHAEWLARKYRISLETAERRIAQLTELARADGIDLRLDLLRPGNTFDAHRLLHLARGQGKQSELKERLMRGYFSEGAAIGRPEALLELAVEVGLEGDEVRATLDGERFRSEVREEEERAGQLGIHGVPFFVLAGRYAISGAQPEALMLAALERAWADVELEPLSFEDGAVCDPVAPSRR